MEVSAWGARTFYRARGDLDHGERCSECKRSDVCPHYYDMDRWDGVHRRIYAQAEGEDGYIRDLCVFSDRHTINDREVLNIRFARGTLTSFTNVTFAPREYSYFYFTGTEGRIELQGREPKLQLFKADGSVETFEASKEHGEHGHGGADMRLISDILGLPGSDPMQKADPAEARRAVLIADLANRSIANGGKPFTPDQAGRDYPPAPPQPS